MTAVTVSEDAIERLAGSWPADVRTPALVVMDLNTRAAVGARVMEGLHRSGVSVEQLAFDKRSGLRPTVEAVEEVRSRLTGDTVLPIAVGSGVITDLVRWAAHLSGREFLSVPTAASMDGYASSMAALELDGVKVTYPARPPRAIFADPRVLGQAPGELTRAGLGDLLGKATAHVDWLASHLLYGEPYSEAAAALVSEPLAFAARHAPAVLAGEPDAVTELFLGLVQSGRAMAMVGSSRPASGCEHHASHFWDLLASRGMRSHAAHGLQVGYATRFAMRLAQFAFGGGLCDLRRPSAVAEPLGPGARQWLGEPSAEIVSAVSEKQDFVSDLTHWPADGAAWEVVRARIGPKLALFKAVDDALAQAGIPCDPGYLGIDEPTLRATFRYATRLRARYTVVDLLEGQAMLDRAIEAMLESPHMTPTRTE